MIGYAITAAVACASGFLLRSEYERRHFVTEPFTIYSDKLLKKEQNFVFLSDLHNNEFGSGNDKLIQAIDKIRPDAVLIGGDMVVSKGGADPGVVGALLKKLSSRYPVYYGNGNHEERMRDDRKTYGSRYDKFVKMLEQNNIEHLSDRSVPFGSDITITGCNLDEIYYTHRFSVPEMKEGEIKRHVGRADRKRFQILLMHSPLFFASCRKWGADLVLSGHFHGGTIRIPFLGGVMTPQYHFFLPWCAGCFKENNSTMIVSRGLGTHSINLRLNDRPQLVWLRLRSRTPEA